MDREELIAEVLQKIEDEVIHGDMTGVAALIEYVSEHVLYEYLFE